jgi:hypothetical protein
MALMPVLTPQFATRAIENLLNKAREQEVKLSDRPSPPTIFYRDLINPISAL